jgi:hypothetical protein
VFVTILHVFDVVRARIDGARRPRLTKTAARSRRGTSPGGVVGLCKISASQKRHVGSGRSERRAGDTGSPVQGAARCESLLQTRCWFSTKKLKKF